MVTEVLDVPSSEFIDEFRHEEKRLKDDTEVKQEKKVEEVRLENIASIEEKAITPEETELKLTEVTKTLMKENSLFLSLSKFLNQITIILHSAYTVEG